jgi:hypothetical protein
MTFFFFSLWVGLFHIVLGGEIGNIALRDFNRIILTISLLGFVIYRLVLGWKE